MFGAWVHGGIFGITKRTLNHTRLCKYLNEFISHSSPKRFTWTSFVFYFNGKARLHVDKYKLKDSYNITFSFGEYTRGGIVDTRRQQVGGPPADDVDDQSVSHGGYDGSTYRKVTMQPLQTKHAVQPYSGERNSLSPILQGSANWKKTRKNR